MAVRLMFLAVVVFLAAPTSADVGLTGSGSGTPEQGAFYFSEGNIVRTIPYDNPLGQEIVDLSDYVVYDPDYSSDVIGPSYTFSSVKDPFELSPGGRLSLVGSTEKFGICHSFRAEGTYWTTYRNIFNQIRLIPHTFTTKVSIQFEGCGRDYIFSAQALCTKIQRDCRSFDSDLRGTMHSICDASGNRQLDFSKCWVESYTTDTFGLTEYGLSVNSVFAITGTIGTALGGSLRQLLSTVTPGQEFTSWKLTGNLREDLDEANQILKDNCCSLFKQIIKTFVFLPNDQCPSTKYSASHLTVVNVCHDAPCECETQEQIPENCTKLVSLPLTGDNGCNKLYEANVQWPALPSCSRYELSCSEYSSDLEGTVRRHCFQDEQTDFVDFSGCYLKPHVVAPHALAWVGMKNLKEMATVLQVLKQLFTTVEVVSKHYYDGLYRIVFKVTFGSAIGSQTYASLNTAVESLANVSGVPLDDDYKGWRVFNPVETCPVVSPSDLPYLVDVHVQGKGGNCSSMSSGKDPMCEAEAICPPSSRSVSVPYIGIARSVYITPIHTTEFGKGSIWLCSDLEVHYPNRFKEFSVKHTLGGIHAGLFNVDENGVISRSNNSKVQGFNQFLYTFVKGTLDDGREYYNFTSTPLIWTIMDGVSYEAVGTQVVGPEVTRGSTIVDLSSGLRIDDTLIKSWDAKFTSSSKQPYEVKVNGRVVLRRRPAALSVLFTVKVNAVSRNGEKFTWTEDHTVTFATTKCSPDGIWPETGACYQATHACTTFGSVFDDYGVVRRQCSQNGAWEKPDFSGCRLKKKQDVILVTFAFRSISDLQYTADMLYDLRNFHLEGVPVESVDFSCDFSTDWASGGDITITFVVVLSEPLRTEPSNVLKYLTGRIGGRRYNHISYQGFLGRDNCPRKTPCNQWGYNLVCALSDSEKCRCRSSAVLVPSPCCAANGKGWNC